MDSLNQLLGREFGNTITVDDDRYRVDADGFSVEIDMARVTTRSLLAIVEHQLLSRIASPFASAKDEQALAGSRAISDRYDACATEVGALQALMRKAVDAADQDHR